MRNIVTLLVVAGLAWYGYTRYQAMDGDNDGVPCESQWCQ
jgi:hypothetical protein